MKKYNNIANHMTVTIILLNTMSLVMIVFFASKQPSIDTIIPLICFVMILLTSNLMYFLLLDQWYFTYYDEKNVTQKWFKKTKSIEFTQVKYMYFVDNLVVLSEKTFNMPTEKINMQARRRIKRILKNEICIVINVYDKLFPKMLLSKCVNSVKVDFDVKEKKYREMFELD